MSCPNPESAITRPQSPGEKQSRFANEQTNIQEYS